MTAGRGTEKATRSGGTCPICRTATAEAYRPFCSKRCADVDLGRWLTGGYAIAGDEAPDEAPPADAGDARREERD